MSGYTPVFRTIFEGSLCGQWPYTAGWLIFLALADKNGCVDMTPQYISMTTGMPIDDLMKCVERFLQPDPASRTPTDEGRRLALIDPTRSWGWRIVNHAKYREKARLQAKAAREVESGENKLRMQDRRGPPETAADPLSNTNTNTNNKSAPNGDDDRVEGLDLEAWTRWEAYRREIRKPIRGDIQRKAAQRNLARFGDKQTIVVEQSIEQGWAGLFSVGQKPGSKTTTSSDPYANAV